MTLTIDAPDVPWTVSYDQRVVDKLEDLETSSGELYEDTLSTIRKIAENPLSGAPKTGALKGFRADHVTHLVVVWSLDPNVVQRRHLDEVDEVYIHGIEHHDTMTDAVKGARKPAEVAREFGVRFDDYDVQEIISKLYDVPGVEVREEEWGNDGVTVLGLANEDARRQVKRTAPPTADVRVGRQLVGGRP